MASRGGSAGRGRGEGHPAHPAPCRPPLKLTPGIKASRPETSKGPPHRVCNQPTERRPQRKQAPTSQRAGTVGWGTTGLLTGCLPVCGKSVFETWTGRFGILGYWK